MRKIQIPYTSHEWKTTVKGQSLHAACLILRTYLLNVLLPSTSSFTLKKQNDINGLR